MESRKPLTLILVSVILSACLLAGCTNQQGDASDDGSSPASSQESSPAETESDDIKSLTSDFEESADNTVYMIDDWGDAVLVTVPGGSSWTQSSTVFLAKDGSTLLELCQIPSHVLTVTSDDDVDAFVEEMNHQAASRIGRLPNAIGNVTSASVDIIESVTVNGYEMTRVEGRFEAEYGTGETLPFLGYYLWVGDTVFCAWVTANDTAASIDALQDLADVALSNFEVVE